MNGVDSRDAAPRQTVGIVSMPPVPVMGACFMALGVAALATPLAWANLWLGLGFGLLHIGFGIWIAVKYGG
jgi:hypothetical protein